jgi:O-Antigen ligase
VPDLEKTSKSSWLPWGEKIGFLLLILLGAGTPLVIFPVFVQAYFQVDTDRSEDLMFKLLYLQGLSGLLILMGAAFFTTNKWQVYGTRVFLPVMALVCYLGWGLISVLTSGIIPHCFYYWLPQGLAIGAALTGPMFLAKPGRIRLILLLLVASGLVVSLIGVAGSLGWYGFNKFAYGADPREAINLGIKKIAQGGAARSGSISTLGNAEYIGGFTAAMIALCAVMFFDWTLAAKNKLLARLVVLAVMGIIMLELAFSGSRQPWISISLAGALRLFLEFRIPAKYLALGFAVVVISLLLGGFVVAGSVALMMGALALLYPLLTKQAKALWNQTDKVNRAMVVGGPLVALCLLIAFSTPGPWNPTGLRILHRFSTLTNPNDESVTERTLLFMSASDMVWENPVFGVGPGRFNNKLNQALTNLVDEDESGVFFVARKRFGNRIADQTHNDYLQTAAETGIPGISFLLCAFLFLLYELLRIVREQNGPERRYALALMVCLVTFFAVMITSFPLQMPSRAAFFWTVVATSLGLIAHCDLKKRSEAENNEQETAS